MRYTKHITYIYYTDTFLLVLLKKKTNFYYPQAVAAFPHWELW